MSDEQTEEPVENLRPPTPFERMRRMLREPPSYWLTRFVLLRLLGLVYAFAFLVLAHQAVPLFGSHGLTPIARELAAMNQESSAWHNFWRMPSLFWFGAPDWALRDLAWVGFGLSLVVLGGFANSLILLVLWGLYFSFVQIGGSWYGYGWEIQLGETGFLAMFLVPLLDGRPFPRRRPPRLVILLFRWLVVRVMLGAGLIKLRGDPCWRDLTCLYYHFETQPLPNPLSRTLHELPHWTQALGVVINHICELLAPLLAFVPRPRIRHLAGMAMLSFQIMLILSGNLSFLNWLTIVAIVACFDDSILARAMPRFIRRRAEAARAAARPSRPQRYAVAALCAVYVVASFPAAANLFASHQKMNYSFNRLNLASAYGAFGTVGRERYEIVFEGTDDATVGPDTVWKEYQFPCKPGDVTRRPCVCAPYQFHLDWDIWFAGVDEEYLQAALAKERAAAAREGRPARGPPPMYEERPWYVHLAWKLLHNDPVALSLLDGNPFPDHPPRTVRAVVYRYWFADEDEGRAVWWRREFRRVWMGPWNVDSEELHQFLDAYGWD